MDKIDLSKLDVPSLSAPQSETTAVVDSTYSRSFFGDHELQTIDEIAEERPEKGVEEESGNLLWMIQEGWKDLHVNTLPAQLQGCLPELHPTDGPHAIFEQPFERERAESSCICAQTGLFATSHIPTRTYTHSVLHIYCTYIIVVMVIIMIMIIV